MLTIPVSNHEKFAHRHNSKDFFRKRKKSKKILTVTARSHIMFVNERSHLFKRGLIMANDTRERILEAALEMFSEKGFEGTNIRELTASLGLAKSSMYRHFKSKEEILDSLLDEMIIYYDKNFGSPENLPDIPSSSEEFFEMTMRMVNFTVHDERIIMVRKLLTIEQFRNERIRKLATKHFLTGFEEMFTGIFRGMIDRGVFRKDDPEMLAFAFSSPISVLIHLCNREPEKTDAAVRKIEEFVRHFIRVYGG